MAKFKVSIEFTFKGDFFIEAETGADAYAKGVESCHMNTGNIYTSLPDETTNWEFNSKPEKSIDGIDPID